MFLTEHIQQLQQLIQLNLQENSHKLRLIIYMHPFVLQSKIKQQMNTQLQYFYQTSFPNVLDKQLNKFISHIKQSKINSLHQLKLQLSQIKSKVKNRQEENLAGKYGQTTTVFSQPTHKISKLYSTFQPKKQEKNSHQQHQQWRRNNVSTLAKIVQEDGHQQRIVYINPLSKIRRHLVQSINIDDMQRVLYKRPQRLNKYQQFCELIKSRKSCEEKQLSLIRNKDKKQGKPAFDQHYQQKQTQRANMTPNIDANFKITARKRFWRQQRSNSPEPTSSQMLNITSLTKTINRN